MKSPEEKNCIPLFLILVAMGAIPMGFPVLLLDKVELFRLINPIHNSWLDRAFEWITFLGNGLFAILLCLITFLIRKGELAAKLFVVFLFSGVLAQILKHLFEWPRPMALLGKSGYPYFIDGITHSGWNSFPSGHCATIFAVAATLAFKLKGRLWPVVLSLCSFLVLYSRIDLGQHFVEDTLAGLVIGIGSSWIVEAGFTYLRNRRNPEKTRGPALTYEPQPV